MAADAPEGYFDLTIVDQSVDQHAERGQPMTANPLKSDGRDDWI